eukprot:gene4417-5174_t
MTEDRTTPTTTPTTPSISSVMPAIGKRLNVQIDQLEARITADKYDTEAWTLLLNEVQSQPIAIARDIYERFLTVFPTAGRYWKLYVEQEMASKNYDMVEKIFLRSLRNVRNVELWKTYITYIRQVKGDSNKEEVVKAFELALEYIGMDISSTPVWLDYLSFLKEEQTETTVEEGAKKSAIRKLYQRAVENPMHDLDPIWKEYEVYENAWNKTLAKALLAEHHTRFLHAKNVYRERRNMLERILRNMLAKPPHASDKEEHQVRQWRKLIAYEKKNPQRFEQGPLRQRVTSTYNQCLLCLYHYPDIWYEAAAYQADCGNIEGAVAFFDRAIQAIPTNLFLHFAYADFLEFHKRIAPAKDIYEKLVLSVSDPLVWIQYMRFARRTERVEGPRKVFKRAKASPECTYHVYIALGFIEYYVNQDTKMARDIFELGLKKYFNDIPYVQFYVDFLTNLNEDNNTRVLFEKILTNIGQDKSEVFWRKYLDFEYRQNQDISTIFKLEKRFQALSPVFEKRTSSVKSRPDPTQMIPYRNEMGKITTPMPPSGSSQSGNNAGGRGAAWDVPEFLLPLVHLFPPPSTFQGPWIDVDALMTLLKEIGVPRLPFDMPNNNVMQDFFLPNVNRNDLQESHLGELSLNSLSLGGNEEYLSKSPSGSPAFTLMKLEEDTEEEELKEETKKKLEKYNKARPLLPPPSKERLKELTEHALEIFDKSKCEENRGRNLLSRLQVLVSKIFPRTNIKLHLFGSSANGMSLRGGDIDICMLVDDSAGDSDTIISKLAAMLKQNVLAIPNARVPIVKFKEPVHNLSCDICINNKLAIYNTKLVFDYSTIDERMRPLVIVVKRWAKRRKINEPFAGTLSSYAYINMVISFLQHRQPPVLPCLQELANGVIVVNGKEYGQPMDDVMVDGFNCKYYDDVDNLIGFGSANTETLGQLVFGFFQTYSRVFNYMTDVVSIRTGKRILKTEKTWETINKKSHFFFSIEDPFETTHNLARVVKRSHLTTIIQEF